jgi:hypothetical protein
VSVGLERTTMLGVALGAAARGDGAHGSPAELLGTWRGTSLCTDRVVAPACHDETVVYALTAGPKPGALRWQADKVVDGQRENMGELEVAFDAAEGGWKAECASPRARTTWRLTVDGAHLSGTARLGPDEKTFRTLDLRRVAAERPAP